MHGVLRNAARPPSVKCAPRGLPTLRVRSPRASDIPSKATRTPYRLILLKQLTRLQTYRCSIPTRTQQAPTCCVRPSIQSQMPRLHVQSSFTLRLRQSSCTVDVTYSPSLTPRTANYSRPRSVEMDGTPYYILMVCGDLVTLLATHPAAMHLLARQRAVRTAAKCPKTFRQAPTGCVKPYVLSSVKRRSD